MICVSFININTSYQSNSYAWDYHISCHWNCLIGLKMVDYLLICEELKCDLSLLTLNWFFFVTDLISWSANHCGYTGCQHNKLLHLSDETMCHFPHNKLCDNPGDHWSCVCMKIHKCYLKNYRVTQKQDWKVYRCNNRCLKILIWEEC